MKWSWDIYKVCSRQSSLTQSTKKLLAHVISVDSFLLWHVLIVIRLRNKHSPQHVDIIISLRINMWNNVNTINTGRLKYMYVLHCNWHGLLYLFALLDLAAFVFYMYIFFCLHIFNQNKTLRYNVMLLWNIVVQWIIIGLFRNRDKNLIIKNNVFITKPNLNKQILEYSILWAQICECNIFGKCPSLNQISCCLSRLFFVRKPAMRTRLHATSQKSELDERFETKIRNTFFSLFRVSASCARPDKHR